MKSALHPPRTASVGRDDSKLSGRWPSRLNTAEIRKSVVKASPPITGFGLSRDRPDEA